MEGSTTSELMEWRVMLAAVDDFSPEVIADPEFRRKSVERCVEEFRKRLLEEVAKGQAVMAYGPLVNSSLKG